jgi:predicted nucleic acid-binding protein
MNLYIDTSALIKRYVNEVGSDDVRAWIRSADLKATGLITRAELCVGINRLLRMKNLIPEEYTYALDEFRKDWDSYQRLPITEAIVARADLLTCQYQLRGYDAIHLACALTWQDLLGAPVSLATFDKELIDAAQNSGLETLSA